MIPRLPLIPRRIAKVLREHVHTTPPHPATTKTTAATPTAELPYAAATLGGEVISAPLGVGEYLVGLRHLLESPLAVFLAALVGVVLQRLLPAGVAWVRGVGAWEWVWRTCEWRGRSDMMSYMCVVAYSYR